MNRLRDESGLDPISEKGIGMLRAVRPTSSPPGLKRRVWATLQQTPVGSPIRSRTSALRVLVVGVGLMVFTATAAATIGGRRIAAGIERLWGRVGTSTSPSERSKPAKSAPARSVVVAEAPGEPTAPTLPPIAQSGASATPAETRAPLGAPLSPLATHGAARPSRAAPLAAETSRERAQVWEALVALRRDHDPNRAAALLDHDLETNRRGVLRQEALVLAIEAASARGDRRGAEGFAHAYQREFPAGRFGEFVRSTLDDKDARLAVPAKP